MVKYTKPELEITEFEIVDVLTISIQGSEYFEDTGWY